ncbi:MAG: alpha/beta hydrolase fold domain-containing protein [Candidatus Levybacteria bacterium]|nr:alpha/beta hydrolase fold domain-containing protein [Candidatus Levybacteria bacterium]
MRKKAIVIGGGFAVMLMGVILAVSLTQQQQETRSRAASGSATLAITPDSTTENPVTTQVGNPVSVDIILTPGQTQVSLVTFDILYDASVLQANMGTIVLNNTAFPVTVEGPIAESGKLAVTVSIGSDPVNAIKVPTKVGTLTFTAIAPTASATNVTFGPLTKVLSVGASDDNVNVLTGTTPGYIVVQAGPTSTPTPTPGIDPFPTTIATPSPTLTAAPTVDPRATILDLTLLLHGIGTGGDNAKATAGGNPQPNRTQRTVTVNIINSNNKVVGTKTGTVTYNPLAGTFTGKIDAGVGLASGSYTVKIKTDPYLKTLVPGIQKLTAGQVNTLPATTLISGDINKDNSINILDYNILSGCYSDLQPAKSCTAANTILADLTDDGKINQFDYNLFLRELTNRSGESNPTTAPTQATTVAPSQQVSPSPTPVTQTGTSLLQPVSTYTSYKNLRYSNASTRLLLDLYVPDHSGVKPLLVYIHGGFWSSGSKDSCPPIQDYGSKTFMHRGFAVACINYRYSSEAIYPAQIEDVKASIRYLRANASQYGLYDTKIAVWGSSAGGHLAALAGTTSDITAYDKGENLQYSSKVDAVVDDFGPIDLEALLSSPTTDPKGYASGVKLLGGEGPDLYPRARAASARTYITADDSPFFIVHGSIDRIVPLSQSQLLDETLRNLNIPSQLNIISGMGHGGAQMFEPARLSAIALFLDTYIR